MWYIWGILCDQLTPTKSGAGHTGIVRKPVSLRYLVKFAEKSRQAQSGKMSKEIRLATVNEHNKATDLWVVIDNKVYDVTKFRLEASGDADCWF